MKQLILMLAVMAVGCGPRAAPLAPTIDEATGLGLAYEVCFVVESLDGRAVGCATLLKVDEQAFLVAAPLELVTAGCRIVEWRGKPQGQKFERSVFNDVELLTTAPQFKLAVLKVGGMTGRRALPWAETERQEFTVAFAAYGARVSKPRPVEAVAVKVKGLTSARAAKGQVASQFFQVDGSLDFKTLGGPLVSQQGELVGVAIGNFWNSTLYCPVQSLRRLIDFGVGKRAARGLGGGEWVGGSKAIAKPNPGLTRLTPQASA